MDAEARSLFHEYASDQDREREVRYRYLLSLLLSSDPDDREHACLAIASVAQDSPPNRAAFFQHGISSQVLAVLQESCRAQVRARRNRRNGRNGRNGRTDGTDVGDVTDEGAP